MKTLLVLFLGMVASPLCAQDTTAPTPGLVSDADAISFLNLDAPGMEKVKALVGSGSADDIQKAYLDYRRTASPAKWRIMPSDEPPAPAAAPDAAPAVDPIGEEICNHHIRNFFYHFDPKEADMGKDFDWTFNPVPHSDPAYTDQWTYCAISRCQFWEKLADIYWKTHNEKYAAEWVAELRDFSAKNPAPAEKIGMFGNMPDGKVSLWLALDAGTRMNESWPYAYYHFLNSPSFTPDAQWLFMKQMHQHAARLMTSLSIPDHMGNWVAIESFGLYTLAVLFPEMKESAGWRDFALARLTKELDRVVPPDGFESELTPNYHMVTLNDGARGPMQLAQLNHLTVPDDFKTKIAAMYRALVTVMDPTGRDVATNDSGPLDVLKTAKDAQKIVPGDPLIDWAAAGATTTAPLPDSTMLPYAGFYAMRGGWKPDDLFLFFRAGPPGTGHEHQDMLEVVLNAWKKTLLFEPGTYPYDSSDWRRLTINTPSHSTIIIDGKWQNRGHSEAPVLKPMDNPWVTTPLFDFAAGTYDAGYETNVFVQKAYAPDKWAGDKDTSVTHTRRVLFLRPYYALLLDTIDGTGHHTIDSHFQLEAPAAHVDATTQAAFSDNTDGIQLGLYPLEKDNLAVDIVQGQKEPLLGWFPSQHRPIPTVRFRKVQDAPAIFATFLYPYQGTSAPAFSSQPLIFQDTTIWGQTLTTPREKAEIALAKDGTSKSLSFKSALVGAVNASASGLVLRQPAGQSGAFAGGWGLTSYSDGQTEFSTDAPANVVVDPQGDHLLFFNGGDKPVALRVTKPFAASATLAPTTWSSVTATGAQPSAAPTLFAPLGSSAP